MGIEGVINLVSLNYTGGGYPLYWGAPTVKGSSTPYQLNCKFCVINKKKSSFLMTFFY